MNDEPRTVAGQTVCQQIGLPGTRLDGTRRRKFKIDDDVCCRFIRLGYDASKLPELTLHIQQITERIARRQPSLTQIVQQPQHIVGLGPYRPAMLLIGDRHVFIPIVNRVPLLLNIFLIDTFARFQQLLRCAMYDGFVSIVDIEQQAPQRPRFNCPDDGKGKRGFLLDLHARIDGIEPSIIQIVIQTFAEKRRQIRRNQGNRQQQECRDSVEKMRKNPVALMKIVPL